MTNNPLTTPFNTPYNSSPFSAIKPEHYTPAFEAVLQETRERIQKIIENPEPPSFENTLKALEFSSLHLGRISSILFNLNVAETGKEVQEAVREVSPMLSDFRSDIILNKVLFERIKCVYENRKKESLNAEETKLLEKTYEDFVRNGANLSESSKERYREINKELSRLTIDFGDNVLAETNDYFLHLTDRGDLSGLPEDVIQEAAEEAARRKLKGWVFTLQFPSFGPFIKYSNKRELREEISIAYNSRCFKDNAHNNSEIIKKISTLRLEYANLLGFETYADFVLSKRMAESCDNVFDFLNELLAPSKNAAIKEVEEIKAFAKSLGDDFEIRPWDWAYYAEKLKKKKFDIDDETTRPYFQLERVEQGVFNLANKLFGIRLKEVKNIPVYHADVKVFEVYDSDNSFIALLYMDYFPRESKKAGAWMTEYQQQHISPDGEDIRPHVSLVFNFTKPTKQKPSLLTYTEVTTLLHEFGHGLHGIFSKCEFESLAGTNVYRDFVELPSQLLENWADQKEWLDEIAAHYETGEKIPTEMVDKIVKSKNFNSGFFSLRQLSFGLCDMRWHTIKEPYTGDIESFEHDAMAETLLLRKTEGTATSAAFSHIFAGGYAAGYYSYKWAEVLDADAFAYFKEKGIYNTEIAKKLRDNILSKGGTEHPMDLYVKFRGKEPSIDPLLERSGLKTP